MDLDATMRVTPASARKDRIYIFDAAKELQTIDLSAFGKDEISFGRGTDNDIVLTSKLASRKHGRFVKENREWFVLDNNSTNGILHNGFEEKRITIEENDFIRIDDGVESVADGVLAVFLSEKYSYKWNKAGTEQKFVLDSYDPTVSADIKLVNNQFYLTVGRSSDILINNKIAESQNLLHEKDVIMTPNLIAVFTSDCIYYNAVKHIEALELDEDMTQSVKRSAPVQETKRQYAPHYEEPVYEAPNYEVPPYDAQDYDAPSGSRYSEPSRKESSGGGFTSFLRTDAGCLVLSLIIAAILWGITLVLWTSQGELAIIVMLICAIFGWQTLNSIQPAMFLWLSWTGWIIYFCVKFVLSAIIGLFVAPFKIGKWIASLISESI